MAETTRLWRHIQDFLDDPRHRFRPNVADIARESGVSEQVLSKWKTRPTLPSPENLRAVADVIGVPAWDLVHSALHDKGYTMAALGSTELSANRRQRVLDLNERMADEGDREPLLPYAADEEEHNIEDEQGHGENA